MVAFAAATLRFVGRLRRPVQGLVVVGSAFYGGWLIFRPAAFFVVAVLLLLDLVTDRS